jgi:hypothetical protein
MLPSSDAAQRIAAHRVTPPRVPPAVKGLSLVSLFNDFASEMVYPLLPAFVTRTLGGGATLLGLLDGAADLTSAVLKVVSGRLADRPRLRGPLILVGYATAVLVRPLIAVAVAIVPLVWAGLHVVRSASSYPGGWLTDHLGPRATVAAGGLVFAGVVAAIGSRWGQPWRWPRSSSSGWSRASRSPPSARWWPGWRPCEPGGGSACIMH